MKKKEFKKISPKEQYSVLCTLTKEMMGLCEKLANIRNQSIQASAAYNKLLSCDAVNAQKMKGINEFQQQIEKITLQIKKMRDLHKEELCLMKDLVRSEKKMRDFLIIFFELRDLQAKDFSFSVSLTTDTIHLYPYRGKSVTDDAKHGHYGIVIGQRRVFVRKYAAYKDDNSGSRKKKQSYNKHDVTETFNLSTFLEYMTLKSAK